MSIAPRGKRALKPFEFRVQGCILAPGSGASTVLSGRGDGNVALLPDFRVFSEEPELLVDLINVVRSDEPPIVEVRLLNPRLTPERLSAWIAYFEHGRRNRP